MVTGGHFLFITIYSNTRMMSSQHAYPSGVISTVKPNTLFIFCCFLSTEVSTSSLIDDIQPRCVSTLALLQ